jgi:hypothetical protein
MKRIIYGVMVIAVTLIACGITSGQSRETRSVSDFTKVSFGVSGNLNIKLGHEFSLEIEGSRRALEETLTEVSGGRLVIRREFMRNFFNNTNDRVTINITMPAIEGLSVSGSGKAQIMDDVEADKLTLSVSGSGKVQTSDIEADDLQCGISGSGNIVLGSGGSVDNGKVTISGSGGFSGGSVEIDHLTVNVSGSGDCVCKVGDSLNAHISGSGNVNYKGNPRVNARVSGSGHVRSI